MKFDMHVKNIRNMHIKFHEHIILFYMRSLERNFDLYNIIFLYV